MRLITENALEQARALLSANKHRPRALILLSYVCELEGKLEESNFYYTEYGDKYSNLSKHHGNKYQRMFHFFMGRLGVNSRDGAAWNNAGFLCIEFNETRRLYQTAAKLNHHNGMINFSGVIKHERPEESLVLYKRAVDLYGSSYGMLGLCIIYTLLNDDNLSNMWCEKGAALGNVECMEKLAKRHYYGKGYPENKAKGISMMVNIASKYGRHTSAVELHRMYSDPDPNIYSPFWRTFWLCKSVRCNDHLNSGMLRELLCELKSPNPPTPPPLMFILGEFTRHHVDGIFKDRNWFSESLHNFAKQAAEFYTEVCWQTEQTTLAWMYVGQRLGIHKDVRILIGKLVWSSRMTLE
jgi:TPR repeat protein